MMPHLLELFLRFLLIGLMGFGGGNAILPLIVDTVRAMGGFDDETIAEMLALAQTSPGAIAINAATYTGLNTAGAIGVLVALTAIITPSFALVFMAVHLLERNRDSLVVNAAFTGIRPVTVAFVAAAVIYIGELSIFNGNMDVSSVQEMGWQFLAPIPVGIFVVSAVLGGRFKLNPIIPVVAGGVIGALCLK
jgi:chromate transporter